MLAESTAPLAGTRALAGGYIVRVLQTNPLPEMPYP